MRMLDIIVVIWMLGAFLEMHVQWFKGCESKRADGRFTVTNFRVLLAEDMFEPKFDT